MSTQIEWHRPHNLLTNTLSTKLMENSPSGRWPAPPVEHISMPGGDYPLLEEGTRRAEEEKAKNEVDTVLTTIKLTD